MLDCTEVAVKANGMLLVPILPEAELSVSAAVESDPPTSLMMPLDSTVNEAIFVALTADIILIEPPSSEVSERV